MKNTFFANIKKALSASMLVSHSPALEIDMSTNAPTGIQHLTIEEYSAVAGGPQVENEPDGA